MASITFSPELLRNDIQVSVAIWEIYNFKITSNKYDLSPIIKEVSTMLKSKYSINNIKDDPIIAKYRKFYWKFLKLDPTKIRPSSEALIRRILKNQQIPKISPFVDAYNWASAASLIGMGGYDINSFEFPIIFRLTKENEKFWPIGREEKKLPRNTLVISDKNEIILSQFPYRDSQTTMVGKESRKIIVIASGVPGISKENLYFALNRTKNNLEYLRAQQVIEFSSKNFEYFY